MRRNILTALLALIVAGCATSRHSSYVAQLSDTTIPVLDLRDTPLAEALQRLRTQWKQQTGTEMPFAQVIEGDYEGENPASRPITIHAEHISFLNVLRIIAAVRGCQLTFTEKEVVLANICEGEFMSFMFPLDASTKACLGLGQKATANDLKAALASRGVDWSHGDMTIDLAAIDSGELLIIGGFRDNAELAKSILALSKAGYEVRKRQESQPPPAN